MIFTSPCLYILSRTVYSQLLMISSKVNNCFIVTGRVGCLLKALIVGRGPSFQLNEIRPSFRMMQFPKLI